MLFYSRRSGKKLHHAQFKKDENNEKIVCVFCSGYYLDSNGNCVDYKQYFNVTENCKKTFIMLKILNLNILFILITDI